MKKFLIGSAAAAVVGGAAVAGDGNEAYDLALLGSIAPVCNFSLTTANTSINTAIPGAQTVAQLSATCNTPGGASITVDSANDEKLIDSNTLEELAYTIGLVATGADVGTTTPAAPAEGAFSLTNTTGTFVPGADVGTVTVDLTDTNTNYAGDYEDTITFTLIPS